MSVLLLPGDVNKKLIMYPVSSVIAETNTGAVEADTAPTKINMSVDNNLNVVSFILLLYKSTENIFYKLVSFSSIGLDILLAVKILAFASFQLFSPLP